MILLLKTALLFALTPAAPPAVEGGPGQAPEPLVVSVRVEASPEEIWQAWTTEAGAKTFFAPDARIEARPGGPYEIYFLPDQRQGLRGSEGATVLAAEPPRRLMFSWNAPLAFGPLREQLTVVEIRIEPLDAAASELTLTHFGWGRGQEWHAVRGYFARVWPVVLARLSERYGDE